MPDRDYFSFVGSQGQHNGQRNIHCNYSGH
jgi:hypothetical protein